MNPSTFPQYRGMQVHAVPDSDKAFDSATGRKLPWAYDLNPAASAAQGQRDPVEKGPFGKGTNRRTRSTLSRSRSKTAEPKREEDRLKAEQLAAEDAVFGSLRRVVRDGVVGGVGGEEKDGGKGGGKGVVTEVKEEASEVVIYGFGTEVQWAALEFYERVSEGTILEDYERQPSLPVSSYQRKNAFGFNTTGHDIMGYPASPHASRVVPQEKRKLNKESLKKKNTYAGGNHWIKVTFDSKNAAELACARSPHVVRGYLVYAEPYEQRGPGRDEAIPATQAGAQIMDDRMPVSFSTKETFPLETSPGGSSSTATSATATAARANGGSQTSSSHTLDNPFRPSGTIGFSRNQQRPRDSLEGILPSTTRPSNTNTNLQLQQSQPQTPGQQDTLRHRRRISGAKVAQVHPASMALAPKKSKQSWSAWLLGTGDVIGSTVPKKEDGTFDWERAGFYWRVFAWVDGVLGTDFCGLKSD